MQQYLNSSTDPVISTFGVRNSLMTTDRAGQGRAGQDRAGQGRAGQGRAGQGRAVNTEAGQDRVG